MSNLNKNYRYYLLIFAVITMIPLLNGCSAYKREVLEQMEKERREEMERERRERESEEYSEKSNKETTKDKTDTKGERKYVRKSDADILNSLRSKSYENFSEDEKNEFMSRIEEYLNTPYLWGGESKNGIDCSSFVQTVMNLALSVKLPRTSYQQSKVGDKVKSGNYKFGDLLFFDTMNKGRVSHVAIYMDNNLFVHSGSKAGVAFASLDEEFYRETFLFANRVIE